MDRHTPTRSTRARPAKAPLSYAAVLDAAVDVLREAGLEALTMRRVAAALDTGPASLYVYVANRDELVTALYERAMAEIVVEAPDPERWREQLHALMGNIVETLVNYPGIAGHGLANIPVEGEVLRIADTMLGILLAGGIEVQQAAWAVDLLPLLATATALEETEYAGRKGDEATVVEAAAQAFAKLPPEQFPHISAHVKELVSGDGDVRFRFMIDTILDGLLARSSAR